MLLLRGRSPIGPLLSLTGHAPTGVGLLIAFGELAVGVGALLGLRTRIAAAGGIALALSFFLTVSWNTTPYYYGSDIVFVFAWLTLLAFGDQGVFSLDHWLRNRVRQRLRLPPEPAAVAIAAPRLRALCPRAGGCGLTPEGSCTRATGCPIFPTGEQLPTPLRAEIDRRNLLAGLATGTLVAALALLTGGLTALLGRAVGGTKRSTDAGLTLPDPTSSTSSTSPTSPPPTMPAPSASPSPTHQAARKSASPAGRSSTQTEAPTEAPTTAPTAPVATPTANPSATHQAARKSATPTGRSSGTPIAATASVPVGQAVSFTNPADGNPAWLVHTTASQFVAFSAICTHAGCPVQFDPAATAFVCPCHGGMYDARTGQVLQGPPPAPLPAVPIQVQRGEVYTP